MPHDWSEFPGRLVVVSGPSGSGKSTILRGALARPEVRARLSVSATSRPPRPGEQQGRDYFFVPREQFEACRDRGEFLEWAEVHGNFYGTPVGPVVEGLKAGERVVLEIDVQGASQVLRIVPGAESVFITAPDPEALEARLRGRGTESDAAVRRRLDNARRELEAIETYKHRIVNHDLDQAVDAMVALLVGGGCEGPSRDA